MRKLEPLEQVKTVFPDTVNDELTEPSRKLHSVTLFAEDFGGSLALPHFGCRRPSADYFNSNLILHNFVQCNISSGQNTVTFYDERVQGKSSEACCSLRMKLHLSHVQQLISKGVKPKAALFLLDNCTSQNKGHVMMQYWAFLSTFYETVITFFLVVGHTHMCADRVVANCRNAIKGKNLYTSKEFAKRVSGVKSVGGMEAKNDDTFNDCFIGWKDFFASRMKKQTTSGVY